MLIFYFNEIGFAASFRKEVNDI